jgi:hypothetical protein
LTQTLRQVSGQSQALTSPPGHAYPGAQMDSTRLIEQWLEGPPRRSLASLSRRLGCHVDALRHYLHGRRGLPAKYRERAMRICAR